MAYFPMFTELENELCLIVGGGKVAARKAEVLTEYGAKVLVVAEDFCDDFPVSANLELTERGFADNDIKNAKLVVAATDNQKLNSHISKLCHHMGIPVNVVDKSEECSFIFPALVKDGMLSIGISTGGASPSAAKFLKNEIANLIPDNTGEILLWLSSKRDEIKHAYPDEKIRSRIYSGLFTLCMSLGRSATESEYKKICEDIVNGKE